MHDWLLKKVYDCLLYTSPFPALVQLKLDAPFLKQIKGVKFVGQAFLLQRERVLEQAEGEILFTEYGVCLLYTSTKAK